MEARLRCTRIFLAPLTREEYDVNNDEICLFWPRRLDRQRIFLQEAVQGSLSSSYGRREEANGGSDVRPQ